MNDNGLGSLRGEDKVRVEKVKGGPVRKVLEQKVCLENSSGRSQQL